MMDYAASAASLALTSCLLLHLLLHLTATFPATAVSATKQPPKAHVDAIMSGSASSYASASVVDLKLRLNLLSASGTVPSAGMPMIPADKPALLTWQLPPNVREQICATVVLRDAIGNDVHLWPCPSESADGGVPMADQNMTLELNNLDLAEAAMYSVSVLIQYTTADAVAAMGLKYDTSTGTSISNLTSAPLRFFTALRAFTASPVWVAPCEGGGRKDESNYVWLRASMKLPRHVLLVSPPPPPPPPPPSSSPSPSATVEPLRQSHNREEEEIYDDGEEDMVVSALAFVSAEAPLNLPPDGCCGEQNQGSKVLGAYKLRVNGQLVGMGPGRPQCGAVAQGDCEQTTPYDGYSLRIAPNSTSIDVEIRAYGQNQPSVYLTQRVIFELVVRTREGKMYRLATGGDGGDGGGSGAGASGIWEGFDADCPLCSHMRPTGNSGGRFGSGYWYYYPHENPSAVCLPAAGGDNNNAVPATATTLPPTAAVAATVASAHGSNRCGNGHFLSQHSLRRASWSDKVVIKPPFTVPLRPKPVPPVQLSSSAPVSTPQPVAHSSPGHFSFHLLTEVQGGVRLNVSHSALFSGATAIVSLSEQLFPQNHSVRVPMYTGASFISNFSLAPGAALEHHEYANFRYGEIRFYGADGQPIPDLHPHIDFDVSAWVVHYPYDSRAATFFNSSSPALNRVWKLTQNSVKILGLDFYTDSNARQRSYACQADATTASQAQFAATPELAMPRQQMRMIMDFSRVPGNVPWPFPPPADKVNGTGGYVSGTWVDWTVLPAINVVNDALYTGDLSPGAWYLNDLIAYHLRTELIAPSGSKYAGLVVDTGCGKERKDGEGARLGQKKRHGDGLDRASSAGAGANSPKRGGEGERRSCLSALIDTSGGSDDGFVQSHVNAVVQAWVYYGLTRIAQLARWLGRNDQAERLQGLADALKSAFNRLFLQATTVAAAAGDIAAAGNTGDAASTFAVCDGICAETNHTAIHASFYALAFGLVDDAHKAGVFSYVTQRIASSPLGFPGGAYPIQFALLALYNTNVDHGEAGLGLLTSSRNHSWLAMMDHYNATTTMECWSPEELPNLSFSHIWSASPAFVIPWYLAGVRPLEPGWKRIEIKPRPGTLRTFRLVMPTVKGPVTANVYQNFGGGDEEEGANTNGGIGCVGYGCGDVSRSDDTRTHFNLSVVIPGNVIAARLYVPRPTKAVFSHIDEKCLLVNGQRMIVTPSAATTADVACVRRQSRGGQNQGAGQDKHQDALAHCVGSDDTHMWVSVKSGQHHVTWCPRL